MNRSFKGVWIPKDIWLSKELSLQEKVFLVEISSLDNSKGCFASNSYFAEFFELSSGRCSQIIAGLKEKGYIKIKLEKEGNQVIRRVLNILKGGYLISYRGYLENEQDSNTVNNTKETIPAFEEFKQYALSKCKTLDTDALQMKYESWIENNWRTGGEKPRKIKNWKTTLLNTIPHLPKVKQNNNANLFQT